MRIAIIGGTGTLGRSLMAELGRRGHDARALARHAPQFRIDLWTGAGLEVALDGCEVVIDASNDASRTGARTLIVGTERLLAAEAAAGVRHHVGISVVGCERIALRYFRLKFAQERLVEAGPTPWSIVRATQFHEFVSAGLSSATRWGVMPIPRATIQSVAVSEVARAVASIAEAAPLRRRVLIAGPEQTQLIDLARTGKRRPVPTHGCSRSPCRAAPGERCAPEHSRSMRPTSSAPSHSIHG